MGEKQAKHGIESVDSQEDPQFWVRCLDKLHQEPFYQSYKARIVELLAPRPGGIYLDVGAGTGDDARALAKRAQATAVVLDRSKTMMSESVRRGLSTAVVGDGAYLPFADDSFEGCWADRTFQHLLDPQEALIEMVRVTKHGGRIVVVDPDYDTQVMEFADQELARRVFRWRAERGLRNGALAHRMPAIFSDLGMCDVQVEPMTLVVRDHTAVDNVMGLRSWAAFAQAAGYVSEEDVTRWERLFDETVAAGRFLWAVTFFLTAGTKPG
jgi:SAM-dependent methyltransferase